MSRGRLRGQLQMRIALRVRNLSRGGAGAVTAAVLPPGCINEVLIELAGEAFVSRAEVRRCTAAERGGGSEVGIEFTGMSARDLTRLARYLVGQEAPAAADAPEG